MARSAVARPTIEGPDGLVGGPDRRRHAVPHEPRSMRRTSTAASARRLDEAPRSRRRTPRSAPRRACRDEVDASRPPARHATPRAAARDRHAGGALRRSTVRPRGSRSGRRGRGRRRAAPRSSRSSRAIAPLAPRARTRRRRRATRRASGGRRRASRGRPRHPRPAMTPGHPGEHPGEVEPQDLAPGLRPRVVGPDVGGPADRQVSPRRLGMRAAVRRRARPASARPRGSGASPVLGRRRRPAVPHGRITSSSRPAAGPPDPVRRPSHSSALAAAGDGGRPARRRSGP